MEFGPHPPPSWSRSRHDKLRVCARRYYWHYYASWGGWDRDADPTSRRAYLLKQLTGLRRELGSSVHRRAFETGFRVAQGLDAPDLEELVDRTREELNRVVVASRDRDGFVDRPRDHAFLRSVWYGEGLDDAEVERVRARIEPTHRALHGHALWEGVRSGDWGIEAMDDPDSVADPRFELDGTPVYAEPDMVLRRSDGRAVVVDWKSGEPRSGDRWQVALYALAIRADTGEERFTGRIEYLAEDRSVEVELESDDLERAARRARESLAEMRSLLEVPEENRAGGKGGFPLTENRSACRWCDYFELCEPELLERDGELPDREG